MDKTGLNRDKLPLKPNETQLRGLDAKVKTIHDGLEMSSDGEIDDRLIRLLGIFGFGLTIPHFTGLFGTLEPFDPKYWVGTLWFVGLADILWHGNRWSLFRQRQRLGWLDRPRQKMALLIVGVFFFTIPSTLLSLVTWYEIIAVESIDWSAIQMTTLTNVICVLFVTHLYETVLLIKDRELDQIRLERLDRARTQAQLDALRSQIDPHYLFNCLNTLAYLMQSNPPLAQQFNDALARTYRYILSHHQQDLVFLHDELKFLEDYSMLLRLRFDRAFDLKIAPHDKRLERKWIIPVSLQLLVENAVKHNIVSEKLPMTIQVLISSHSVEVNSSFRPRAGTEAKRTKASGIGLRNLDTRMKLIAGRGIEINRDENIFRVKVPLIDRQGDHRFATIQPSSTTYEHLRPKSDQHIYSLKTNGREWSCKS